MTYVIVFLNERYCWIKNYWKGKRFKNIKARLRNCYINGVDWSRYYERLQDGHVKMILKDDLIDVRIDKKMFILLSDQYESD